MAMKKLRDFLHIVCIFIVFSFFFFQSDVYALTGITDDLAEIITYPSSGEYAGEEPLGGVDTDYWNGWQYNISGDYIKLLKYEGDSVNIVVPASISINGIAYKTKIDFAGTYGDYFVPEKTESFQVEKGVSAGNISFLFNNCTSLKSVDISGLDTSSVVNLNGVFYNCPLLKSVDISALDTSRVENVSWLFGSSGIESMDLSSLELSNIRDFSQMFSGCLDLKEVRLGSKSISKVENASYMFAACSSLANLDLGSIIITGNINSEGMLSGCNLLDHITAPVISGSAVIKLPSVFSDAKGNAVSALTQNTAASCLVKDFGFHIHNEDFTMTVGESRNLKATDLTENGERKTVHWKSSDPETVRINETSGRARALKPGEVTITAVSADGTLQDTCLVRAYPQNEIVTDNYWNVLTLIYTNISDAANNYYDTFNDSDVQIIEDRVTRILPYTVQYMSEGRMKISNVDVEIIDTPVTSVTGLSANLTVGPGKDIDFDRCLENNNYDLVVIYAPLLKHPLNGSYYEGGWQGLGGDYYTYKGQRIYRVIINVARSLHAGEQTLSYKGRLFDSSIAVLIHEMLHDIETNSSSMGVSGYESVHSATDNGYDNTYDFLDFYSDLMSDTLKSGKKGFSEVSFQLTHAKKSIADDYSVKGITLKTNRLSLEIGATAEIEAVITPETAEVKDIIWKSLQPDIVEIENGKVRAIRKGKAVIEAKTVDGGYTAYCTVFVSCDDKLYLALNQKTDLNTVFEELFGTTFQKYAVSSEIKGAAVVSAKGVMTAKKAATVTVTGLEKEGKGWTEKSDTGVEFELFKPEIKQKQVELLRVGAVYQLNENITGVEEPTGWTSSNEKMVSVYQNDTGTWMAVGKKTGNVRITAFYGEGSQAAKYQYSIKVTVPKLNKSKVSLLTGGMLKLSLSNIKQEADWSCTPGKLTLKETGDLYNKKAEFEAKECGEAVITANIDGVDYRCYVEVKEPVLRIQQVKLKTGKKKKITLSNTKIKTVDWKSEKEEIAMVDDNGVITGIGVGETVIYTETGGKHNSCKVIVSP
ncbi:MAG: Ig-like domain-containing protein [Lachnospiraceae bacterium]|nr:Ig-like domain-containing protein [Lachnospiraceae bacterium]